MISNKTLLTVIGVFSLIGFGVVIIGINDFWDWLVRNDYDGYVLFGSFSVIALVLEIIAFVKLGWKAAIQGTLIISIVLGVVYGIFRMGGYVAKETNTFVGVLVIIVLIFGFGIITETLAKREKQKEESQPDGQ